MKKLILLSALSCIMLLSEPAKAQKNIVKLSPVGLGVQTGVGTTGFFGIRAGRGAAQYLFLAGFEHFFKDNISVQGDIGFLAGVGVAGIIKPSFKYYVMQKNSHNVHAGAYMGIEFAKGFAVIAFGPQGGYQYMLLDDRLALFSDLGFGVGINAKGGASKAGFNMLWQVGAGYAF